MKNYSLSELRRIRESYEENPQFSFQQPFSTKTLDDLKTFKNRVKYCKDNLKYLGKGSSRMAFMMPNGHVLKLAFNRKGVAQNQVETGDWYKNSLNCFSECYGNAGDYTWCEVEAAAKVRPMDFPRLLGLTFGEMNDILVYMTRKRGNPSAFRYYHFSTPMDRLKEIEDSVWSDPETNEVLYGLFEYIGNYGAEQNLVSDFFNIKNWGIVSRDGKETLVVTDSGLNDEVWNEYYRR